MARSPILSVGDILQLCPGHGRENWNCLGGACHALDPKRVCYWWSLLSTFDDCIDFRGLSGIGNRHTFEPAAFGAVLFFPTGRIRGLRRCLYGSN